MEGLGSHSGVLGKSPGGVCVMLRVALSLVRDDSRDICLSAVGPVESWHLERSCGFDLVKMEEYEGILTIFCIPGQVDLQKSDETWKSLLV